MGIGLTLGPLMSSAVYGVLGYANTFYYFAVFILVFGFGSVLFMPARIDKVIDCELEKTETEIGGIPGRSGSVASYGALAPKVRAGSQTSARGILSMDLKQDELHSRASSMK